LKLLEIYGYFLGGIWEFGTGPTPNGAQNTQNRSNGKLNCAQGNTNHSNLDQNGVQGAQVTIPIALMVFLAKQNVGLKHHQSRASGKGTHGFRVGSSDF